MKTFSYYLKTVLCFALLLCGKAAFAQHPFPSSGAPIFGVPAGVTCGQLKDPDKTIWFKVNGSMVAAPHDQMFGKVPAGSKVDVNFNVPKPGANGFNRYTLVTYTVSPNGVRLIYDYQSNAYFSDKPSTGSSNQQLALVPTCKFEVYWVKGCVIKTFTLPPATPVTTTGPTGNPYGTNVLRFANGGSGVCNTCPVIVGTNNCVSFRLLEVIDDPIALEKELIFSVINNVNTINNNCGAFPYIGDVLFSKIAPTHVSNNQPYSFRYNYQLGPVIPNYPIKPLSFVFDQRNNHDLVGFDQYQSEIFRFKVTNAEFLRLSNLAPADPQPEICAELSDKHPEPHNTLPPLYCANIDFSDCAPCETVIDDPCEKEDCCFNYVLLTETNLNDPTESTIGFEVTNLCGTMVTEVNITLPVGAPTATLDPVATPAAIETFTPNTATPNLLRFLATPGLPSWDAAGETMLFRYDLPTSLVLQPGKNMATITIITASGSFTQTFDLTNPDCGIVVLPVSLLNFQGKSVNEGIALDWKTATEKNNDRFEVERSADARSFEKIGEMKGNGTTSSQHDYGYTDKHPASNLNYYRLRQVDFDGKFVYSNVVSVRSGDVGSPMTVYPNPAAGGSFNVRLHTNATQVTLQIRDITGKLIHSQEVKNTRDVAIDGKALGMKQGVYLISLKIDDNVTIERLIIE
jgi:hypothetical protein